MFLLPLSTLVSLSGEESTNEEELVLLPMQEVHSYQVAHAESATGLTTPVTQLRFQPQIDLQSRNYVEGQADIVLRGATFENSGILVGGAPLFDPQTGHFLAEIPVSLELLEQPQIYTGADNALRGFNASAGTIAWKWRQIEDGGNLRVSRGQYRYRSGQVYQGLVLKENENYRWAVDGSIAASRGDGTRAWGEHRMDRYNLRTQLSTAEGQTDLFYGYQSKFYGWPNLYTPYNSNETDNLQTTLIALNHIRPDGVVREVSLFYRELRDEYQFNRFSPTKNFQHETWVAGVSVNLGEQIGDWYWETVHGVFADEIRSASLGTSSREYFKNAVLVGKIWRDGDSQIRTEAGVNWEASSREYGKVYPILRVRWMPHGEQGPEGYVEFSGTSQVPGYTALNSSPTAGLFRGNPNLQRERSRNMETGWIQPLDLGVLKTALFLRQDRGLVDWTFSSATPNARSASALDVDTWGVEILWSGHWERIQWSAGYTFLRKFSDYGDASVDSSFYALNYPRHRFTLSTQVDLGYDLQFNFDQQYRWQTENLLRQAGGRSGWYGLASLSWFVPWVDNLELEVGIDNLWNSRFQEVPQVPYSSRTYFVSARYSW